MNLPPHPFFIALQFLTRLPITLSQPPPARASGRSVAWYPAVGLLLGGALALAAAWLPADRPLLAAALLLLLWVAASGALHLDGLADSADAWVGGAGDRVRTLAIMHDPACGPMAVAAVVLVLLLKFAALASLMATQPAPALLLAPLLGRAAVPALFLTTPYLRPQGLGSALASELSRRQAIASLAAAAALAAAIASPLAGVAALAAATLTFWVLRRALLRRLGGTTGDTAGALIELTETAVVVGLALLSS